MSKPKRFYLNKERYVIDRLDWLNNGLSYMPAELPHSENDMRRDVFSKRLNQLIECLLSPYVGKKHGPFEPLSQCSIALDGSKRPLKAGVWFRRGRLLIVSPDSLGTACPLSGRNSCLLSATSGAGRRPHDHAASRPAASGVPFRGLADVARPAGR